MLSASLIAVSRGLITMRRSVADNISYFHPESELILFLHNNNSAWTCDRIKLNNSFKATGYWNFFRFKSLVLSSASFGLFAFLNAILRGRRKQMHFIILYEINISYGHWQLLVMNKMYRKSKVTDWLHSEARAWSELDECTFFPAGASDVTDS